MKFIIWNLIISIALFSNAIAADESICDEAEINEVLIKPLKSIGALAEYLSFVIDPNIIQNYKVGEEQCPKNIESPSENWQWWKGSVSKEESKFATVILENKFFPMGAFVTITLNGKPVGARVEWHSYKGKTGEKGCFRGVSLFQKK